MTTTIQGTATGLRAWGLSALVTTLLVGTASDATADYRGSYGSGGGHHHSTPSPAPTTRVAQSSPRTYHYSVVYRDGVSKYGWLGFPSGRNNDTGYRGPGGGINRPHRSDWNAKLQAQRRWDEQQYKKMQQTGGVECGLSNAPAYCYKLHKPYPQVIEVVRY